MRNLLRDFFYFSRGERRGILVLITGIVIVFLSGCLYPYLRKRHAFTDEDLQRQATAVAEYESFIASVRDKEKQWGKRFEKGKGKNKLKRTAILSSFNPNTADSTTFLNLGLPDWMARNILHYRKKGGKFRKAEDFRKIYGMTDEQYRTLLPYIRIARENTIRSIVRLYDAPAPKDSFSTEGPTVYKYPAGTVIDLNYADTTELKKIPGIGSGIARLIAGYRQRLGGFYSIEQLREIRLDTSLLRPWFSVNSEDICRINLNRAGIERLRNHPYINFYQAKAFVEYRKKKGKLRNLKPFTLYEEFSDSDLERISHYICFE